MSIEIILWDFGDTLVDQRWMLKELPGFSAWPTLFVDEIWDGDLGDRWSRGDITSGQAAERLAAILGTPTAPVLEHMQQCSRNIHFFPGPQKFSTTQDIPQAIVTVNPDIFSEVVVPHYQLMSSFNPIVTSWQEKQLNKADLCDITLEQVGIKRPAALLIDNMEQNIDEWVERGGKGYWYRGERGFIDDINAIVSDRSS